jgi:alpha-glucosidase (family GH31 glycosyl hydrolase)
MATLTTGLSNIGVMRGLQSLWAGTLGNSRICVVVLDRLVDQFHSFKPLLPPGILLAILLAIQPSACAGVFRTKFNTASEYLVVEILDDDLAHFEISARGPGPSTAKPLYTSPMVLKTDYPGPSSAPRVSSDGNTIETTAMKLEVFTNSTQICVKLIDKNNSGARLTTVCPVNLHLDEKGIDIEPGKIQNIYGLGQNLNQVTLGTADGDRLSQGVRKGSAPEPWRQNLGNGFEGLQNAAVGNVQIPVYYAVGSGNLNYALFMDNVYWQKWDFTKSWWQARMFGDQLRFYFMTGKDLPDLRSDFMELTGTPPVPPRKSFGLWVSEFGYDNWNEIDTLKDGLRKDKFPLDGFVLDLNWFGGVATEDASKSNMGRLNWDENEDALAQQDCLLGPQDKCGKSITYPYFFANPSNKIKAYDKDDIRLTAIEESYLANSVDTFTVMPSDLTSYSRTAGKCDPETQSPDDNVTGFWGKGRMIDWSDPKAGQWFHDNRRFPNLVKKGVNAHWTDLGEPENFNPNDCYEGVETSVDGLKNQHSDIHNLHNLLWNKSIWDGYFSKKGTTDDLGVTNPRPFIVTRSGAAGTQRYGAAMWSGDIASNLDSLASHGNAQMQMSFSGIDYYGADTGGFRREVMPGNNGDPNGEHENSGYYTGYESELFTQWFANASWFDVPVRPHTDNEFKGTVANPSCASNIGKRQPPCYETAPNVIGKKESNLANIRQRYELLPYYYSLGYRAYLKGEPLVPPPLFYYQNDLNLRLVGNEKLIGRDILVGMVAKHGEYERDVYLPAGDWVNYYSQEWFDSKGETIKNVPTYRGGIFRLPAFVKAGAILPQMYMDERTKDAFGHRTDGSKHDELIVNVYANTTPSDFTLYEDDGLTLNYESNGRPFYEYRATAISQNQTGNTVKVTIDPAVNQKGAATVTTPYPGAVMNRANIVKLVVKNASATAVTLNGIPLPKQSSQGTFDAASNGWYDAGDNLVLAKSDKMAVSASKTFSFNLRAVGATTSVNFVCDAGITNPGESIYIVGNLPELGSGDPAKAVKLDPNIYYDYILKRTNKKLPGPTEPVWTGVVSHLPPSKSVQWQCLRRKESAPFTVLKLGADNKLMTTTSGYVGHSYGKL